MLLPSLVLCVTVPLLAFGPWNDPDVWLSAANADTEKSDMIISNIERVNFFTFISFFLAVRLICEDDAQR
jgi:hypothetical protein